MYEKIKLGEGFWAIQDGNVRMYFMDDGENAILIDTGYGSGDLRTFIESFSKSSIVLVNTHCHHDHISGNRQFEKIFVGKKDKEAIAEMCTEHTAIVTVKEGDVITAGAFSLEVIDIPGHTPGSIALLDRKNRRLFTADSVAKNFPVYMQYPGQYIDQYMEALLKMKALDDAYDTLHPCHGELMITKEDLDNTIICCKGIIEGTIPEGQAQNAAGEYERAYCYKDIAIFH